MNNRKYLVIGLLIILVFSIGCVSENTSPKSGTPVKSPITTTTINPVKTTIVPTQTPEPTEYVNIKYNAQTVDKFREKWSTTEEKYQYPKTGNVFLVITVNVSNIGYPLIKTSWLDWGISISTKDNPNTYVTIEKSISNLGNVDIKYPEEAMLENGGYIKGQIPFEVPANWDNYKIFFKRYEKYNIKWQPENQNNFLIIIYTNIGDSMGRTAEMILGILGGIFGIFSGIFAVAFG